MYNINKVMNNRKKFCISHSADYDGIFSAELVRFLYNDVTIIPINYADKLVNEIFNKFDFNDSDVIICDFSFSDDIMQKFVDICHEVVWCDHHKTAIDRITKQQYFEKIKGCQSVKYSGAELTWAWLYNNGSIDNMDNEPEIIKWIGMYDTWSFKNDNEKEYALYIQNGLKAYGIVLNNIEFNILLNQQHEKYQELLNYIINIGKLKREYQLKFQFHLYADIARTVQFVINGIKLNACVLNAKCYSDTFMYAYDSTKHDFCLRYTQTNDGKWTYSVYIIQDKKPKVDAITIAKYISPENSGGHINCAGASTDNIITELV